MTPRKNEASWIESRQRWQISIQRDCERKTFTSKTAGKQGKIEAERKADKWLKQGALDSSARLEKMWGIFLEYNKPGKNGKSSNGSGLSNYVQLESIGRNYILPDLKTKRLCNISTADWQSCIDNAYKKGLAKKTLKNIRGAITRFYDFVVNKNIDMPPLRKLKIQKDAPEGERKILQPADLDTLFNSNTINIYGKDIECFYIHAFRFFVLTGLRRGELCGLEKSDLSGEHNEILHINRSINDYNIETKGKNENARRWMILPDMAMEELRQQEEMLKHHGIISPYLFPDEYGNRLEPKHLYAKWCTYRKQHGITCSLHELRHTMISLNKNSVPPELLKLVVGHSQTMDTFGTYGHEVEGEKQTATNLINQTLRTYIK